MWYRFLTSFILGFVLHKTTHKRTRPLGPRWGLLMRYAIGSSAIIPIQLFIWVGLDHENDKEKLVITSLLSLFTFGPGVLLGHLLDKKN